MEELWGCFKHIGIPMETLYKMPTRTRKFYISLHNEETNKANMKNRMKSGRNNMNINSYAKLEQEKSINLGKETKF